MLQSIHVVLRGVGCVALALVLSGCGSSELEPVKVKDVRTNPDSKPESADKLQSAISSKDLASVKALLAKRADPNVPLGSREETAVHLAVREGTPEILSYVLSKGGKTNALNRDRYTPLLVAIELGNLECVKILVSSGAEVNARAPRETGNGGEPVPVLRGKMLPVNLAAQKNRLEILKLLVDNGAETDKMDPRKRTLLFFAAEGGDEEMMRYALSLGLDINHIDKTDTTALMVASEEGNIPAIKALVAEGADINNPKDNAGRTALMCAKMKRKADAVKTLIELGAKEE